MRDELKDMVPIYGVIGRLQKKLLTPHRAFARQELTVPCGERAPLEERGTEQWDPIADRRGSTGCPRRTTWTATSSTTKIAPCRRATR